MVGLATSASSRERLVVHTLVSVLCVGAVLACIGGARAVERDLGWFIIAFLLLLSIAWGGLGLLVWQGRLLQRWSVGYSPVGNLAAALAGFCFFGPSLCTSAPTGIGVGPTWVRVLFVIGVGLLVAAALNSRRARRALQRTSAPAD